MQNADYHGAGKGPINSPNKLHLLQGLPEYRDRFVIYGIKFGTLTH